MAALNRACALHIQIDSTVLLLNRGGKFLKVLVKRVGFGDTRSRMFWHEGALREKIKYFRNRIWAQ